MSLARHKPVGKWQSVRAAYSMAIFGVFAGIGAIVAAVRWLDTDPKAAVLMGIMGGLFFGLAMAFYAMGHYRQFWNDHFERDVYAE